MTDPELLHEPLWHHAQVTPTAIAVADESGHLTYEQLAAAAARQAHALLELGVAPGDRVGVHLDRSTRAVVALAAVLTVGAVCVPLDPDAPTARLATILSDCDVQLVVSEASKVSEWEALLRDGASVTTLLVPDAPSAADVDLGEAGDVRVVAGDEIAAHAARRPELVVHQDALAYLLYTSGSTGAPKGISLSHRNVRAFVDWAVTELAVSPTDRLANHAPFHFDLSLFDLYAASSAGAAVVIAPRATSAFPRETRRFIEDEGITIWYSVPWVLAQLAERGGLSPGDLPRLRVVLFAGEVFAHRPLVALRAALPDARLVNLYGPTESNVCTWYEVPPHAGDIPDPLPIGHAIRGVETRVVLDDGDTAVEIGEVGELLVHGPTIMQGYWADPERTAAALVPDPTDPARPGMWLRTGDLAELLPTGELRFHGRRDDQVKHRGHRIELGDVEAALAAHPAVAECAVTVVPDGRTGSRLLAFVVLRADDSPSGGGDGLIGEEVTSADLRRACAERLPRSVVPDEFRVVGTIPRTSTGKIDRRALATLEE